LTKPFTVGYVSFHYPVIAGRKKPETPELSADDRLLQIKYLSPHPHELFGRVAGEELTFITSEISIDDRV